MDLAGEILAITMEGMMSISSESMNVPAFMARMYHRFSSTGTYDT